MKKFLTLLFCLLVVSSARAVDSSTSPSKKRPTLGMTMAAVRDYYGAPYHRVTVDGKERWYYYLKFAEVYGRQALVPFRFSSDNVYLGNVTFGQDGKVQGIDWVRTQSRGIN